MKAMITIPTLWRESILRWAKIHYSPYLSHYIYSYNFIGDRMRRHMAFMMDGKGWCGIRNDGVWNI